ncbi:chorismate mutase [Ralstonia pseudosolanacearum]|uniref:chorismate mutase n=1 Tax=Ralstonia pseudosolanacearum TaxID=1310165 RepID=UPI001FF8D0E3|nr:chorismate mutase [Ralstonia pseudosolanacearum]
MKTLLKRPGIGIRQTAALACALWLTAGCAATGAGTQENAFAPLVRGLAERLTTADQVALSKWDTGQSVYDPEREAKVIANVSGLAPSYGLTVEDVASVFADQMEANKTVQYALLNGWRRDGAAPSAPRQSLRDVIRPQLDTLQASILAGLRDTASLRRAPDCQAQAAVAVGQVARERSLDAVHRVALDRATARLCVKR